MSAYLFQFHGRHFEAVSRERKALYDLADKIISGPSIVFIRGTLGKTLILGEEDAVRTPPALNTKILYAHDLQEKNAALMRYYPDRSYYRGTYDSNLNEPKLEKLPVIQNAAAAG